MPGLVFICLVLGNNMLIGFIAAAKFYEPHARFKKSKAILPTTSR